MNEKLAVQCFADSKAIQLLKEGGGSVRGKSSILKVKSCPRLPFFIIVFVPL